MASYVITILSIIFVWLKGVARGPGSPHAVEMLFQVFKLNFSGDALKMHYFSNKFSKIAKR